MHTTIINDCRDDNAAGRQTIRAASLINSTVSFIGVASDLEASGALIDALDAYGDNEGVILVNVAPRNGAAKKWKNGTPFGYFRYQNVLIVASIDGVTLSLAKKCGIVQEVRVLDIDRATEVLLADGAITEAERAHIIETQFRSFDFVPRVAAYLCKHADIDATPLDAADIPDAPSAVWFVDNFGNCKTTLTYEDLAGRTTLSTPLGEITHIAHLADVPDNTTAVVTGSSGIHTTRFLEIVAQGASAAEHHALASGSPVGIS